MYKIAFFIFFCLVIPGCSRAIQEFRIAEMECTLFLPDDYAHDRVSGEIQYFQSMGPGYTILIYGNRKYYDLLRLEIDEVSALGSEENGLDIRSASLKFPPDKESRPSTIIFHKRGFVLVSGSDHKKWRDFLKCDVDSADES